MWGVLSLVTSALNAWVQQKAIANRPDLVKNKLDLAKQQARDALHTAEGVAADPNATHEQHEAALLKIRLAGS